MITLGSIRFYLHLPSPSKKNIEFIHIIYLPSGTLTELWKIVLQDMAWCDWGLSPNKIKPYFGKVWKTHWSLQNHGSWRPFWEGSGPLQNQDHPSSELSTCLPLWFYAHHLWGSGYDSVSNFPYKIHEKNACFRGSGPMIQEGKLPRGCCSWGEVVVVVVVVV